MNVQISPAAIPVLNVMNGLLKGLSTQKVKLKQSDKLHKTKPNGNDSDYKMCDINPGGLCEKSDSRIVRKRNIRRNRKRKCNSSKAKSTDSGNFSSLMELDLEWLFDDENQRVQHRKGEHRFISVNWLTV